MTRAENQTEAKIKERRGAFHSLFLLLTRRVVRRQLEDEDPSQSRGQSEESIPLAAEPRRRRHRIGCQARHAGNHTVIGGISEVDFANICKHGLDLALCDQLLEERNGRECKS